MMAAEQSQHSTSRGWLRAGLELSAASLLLAGALAALTGSPAITACAVAILAAALLHAILLRQSAHDGAAAGVVFWSYVGCGLIMALASGAATALVIRSDATRATDWPLAMELGGLVALTLAHAGWLAWNLRDLAGPASQLGTLPPGLSISDPARIALLVSGVVTVIASVLALIATAAAWGFQWLLLESMGAILIALVLVAAAIYLALETRDMLERSSVEPRLLQVLTEAIGVAAMKSGAIRRVIGVDARHGPPGTVIVTVHLEFKEGVDARHVAPVLATLHKAATEAAPDVTALVLGGSPPRAFFTKVGTGLV